MTPFFFLTNVSIYGGSVLVNEVDLLLGNSCLVIHIYPRL